VFDFFTKGDGNIKWQKGSARRFVALGALGVMPDKITTDHISKSIQFCSLDRPLWG
jgi:aconitase A